MPELLGHGRRRSGRPIVHHPRGERHAGRTPTGLAVGRARPAPRRGSRAPADAGRVLPEDVHPATVRVADGRAGDPAGDGFGTAARGRAGHAHRLEARPVRHDRGRRRDRRPDRGARGRGGRRTRAPVRRVRDRLARRTGSDARRDPGARGARPVEPRRSRSSRATPRSACSTGRACRSRARASSCRCAPSASWWRPAPPRRTSSSPATTCPACGSGARHPRWRRCTASRRAGAWWSSRPPTEGVEHLRALVAAGTPVVAALVPSAFVDEVPRETEAIVDGELVEARGHGRLRSVVVRERGERRRIRCDALVLSMGLAPRDELARMAVGEPVRLVGDAALDADEPRLRRRLPLPVRGRCAARRRAGLDRGVPLRRDPQAVHDRDDGPLQGRDVRARAGVLRARPRGRGRPAFGRADDGAPAPAAGRPGDARGAGPRGRSRSGPACTTSTSRRARRSGGRAGGSARSRTATRPRSTARCANASA